MSEHTPGPWVFMDDDTFYGEIRDCETFTEIARMPDMDDRPDDFRLIAAAPDLLEACEKFISSFASGQREKCDIALIMAKEAVARARGVIVVSYNVERTP